MDSIGDFALENFLRCGARKIRLGPDGPATDLLVLGELLVRVFDRRFDVGVNILRNDDRKGFVASWPFNGNDTARAYFWLAMERGFKIFGINIQPRRADDHVLLPAFEKEVSVRVELANVACVQPFFRTPVNVTFAGP